MRYTREDLKALQAATLDEKIDHSLSIIEIFYLREHGNCHISFSGGKDSTVLKYLIEHEYPARGGQAVAEYSERVFRYRPRIPGNSEICHAAGKCCFRSPENEFS